MKTTCVCSRLPLAFAFVFVEHVVMIQFDLHKVSECTAYNYGFCYVPTKERKEEKEAL